ncbi:hypothetical protein ACLOJK_015882 [Asimina triloba]
MAPAAASSAEEEESAQNPTITQSPPPPSPPLPQPHQHPLQSHSPPLPNGNANHRPASSSDPSSSNHPSDDATDDEDAAPAPAPAPKKQKPTSTTPPESPMPATTRPPTPSSMPTAKKKKPTKKKSNNVWTKPTSRKHKKKVKPAPAPDDTVLITPIPRFPDKSDDSPDAQICLSKMYKAEKVELSDDRLTAGSCKGYRMVRATRGVVEGAWYFEIKVLKLGETGHTRLGWTTEKGDLQAPVGYDGNSYGYRDADGTKIHKAMREAYGKVGYVEGDVVGCYISLPEGGSFAPKPPQLVWYKGQRYMCAADGKEDPPKVVPVIMSIQLNLGGSMIIVQLVLDGFMLQASDLRIITISFSSRTSEMKATSDDQIGEAWICFESMYFGKADTYIPAGSEISFFKNGECQGVAFANLFGGLYYPAASMYTLPNQPNCLVKFNFGPEFECFPEDFGDRPTPKPMIEVPYHGLDVKVEGATQNGLLAEKKNQQS